MISETTPKRILEIREMITETHWQCIEPFIGGRGGFGETFCGHIHRLNMTFNDQAEHYGITLWELADVTADHICNLSEMTKEEFDNLGEVVKCNYSACNAGAGIAGRGVCCNHGDFTDENCEQFADVVADHIRRF